MSDHDTVSMSRQELGEELTVQNVVLRSLVDATYDGAEEMRQDAHLEIARLKKLLHNLNQKEQADTRKLLSVYVCYLGFIPDLTLLLTEEVFEDRRDRRLNTASTSGMMKSVLIFFCKLSPELPISRATAISCLRNLKLLACDTTSLARWFLTDLCAARSINSQAKHAIARTAVPTLTTVLIHVLTTRFSPYSRLTLCFQMIDSLIHQTP